jgi:hypothetical protein
MIEYQRQGLTTSSSAARRYALRSPDLPLKLHSPGCSSFQRSVSCDQDSSLLPSSSVCLGTKRMTANFDGPRFYGETRFGHASFGVSLSYDGAAFRAPTEFDSLNCGSCAFFQRARFDDVDFRHVTLGRRGNVKTLIAARSLGVLSS